MRMLGFSYLKPDSLKEASKMLARKDAKSRVIAGGTDLVVNMKHHKIIPDYVVDITGIPGLNNIQFRKKDGLKIGALCTHDDVLNSPVIKENYPLLAQAVKTVGSVQVRCLGTIGGNLCNASPCADSAPALICLDGNATVVNSRGERSIPVEELLIGPGTTALKQGEILAGIEVPPPAKRSGGAYIKMGRRKAFDLSLVSAAVYMSLSPNGKNCKDIRIVLGSVAPVPMRARKAEAVLRGKPITKENIQIAANVASEEAKPITDIRASAGYRRAMAEVLTRRAIQQATEVAKKSI